MQRSSSTGSNRDGRALAPHDGRALDAQAFSSERTLDFEALIAILLRQLPLILGTAAAFLALAVVYILLASPTYTSTAQVLIDPRKKQVMEDEMLASGIGDNFVLVDSQVKVIASDAVLRPVVRAENLAADPDFVGAPETDSFPKGLVRAFFGAPAKQDAPADPEERALEALYERLAVERSDQTYVINITVRTSDPDKSARLAQKIAESYLEDQSSEKTEMTFRVQNLMGSRLDELREELRKAETRVQEFRAEHDLQEARGELMDTQELAVLNDEIVAARAQVARTGSRFQELQGILAAGVEPDMLNEAVTSQTITRLREQYARATSREANLGANLMPAHPTLQEARTEAERLKDLIREEVERIADAVKVEHEIALKRLEKLQQRLEATRRETNENNAAQIRLRELMREAETTRSVYESFLGRVKEMGEQMRIYTPDARVISPAPVPKKPSWPVPKLVLAAALFLGVATGGSLGLMRERFDRSVRTEGDVVATTGLRNLVTIPHLGARSGLSSLMSGSARVSYYDVANAVTRRDGAAPTPFQAAVHRLMTHIFELDAGQRPRAVLLTSSLAGEGKTALAFGLGVAAAARGRRTLLVDANSSRPALTKLLLGEGGRDVTDIVMGRAKLADLVKRDNRLNMSFLSLAADGAVMAELPDHDGLAEEFEALIADYDLVLIDGAEANLLGWEWNAEIVADAAQACLFLVRSSATTLDQAAESALETLRLANGKPCAAVLTMAGGNAV